MTEFLQCVVNASLIISQEPCVILITRLLIIIIEVKMQVDEMEAISYALFVGIEREERSIQEFVITSKVKISKI
jgi:hypothetical protein